MKLSEVKDIVREQVGRDKLSDPALDWAIQQGLREIEKRDNFYWMEADQIFQVLENQQEYVLSDIGVTDLKEVDTLLVSDRTTTDPCWSPVVGPVDIKDTKLNFTEGSSDKPGFFSLREEADDPTILMWPPLPDQDYRAQLFYYRWTSLPASAVSTSHEVLRRWPEALIYLATEQGILISTKDTEMATFWRVKFENPNPQIQSEYKRIKLYQQSRKSPSRPTTQTSNNNTTLTERLRSAQRAWF